MKTLLLALALFAFARLSRGVVTVRTPPSTLLIGDPSCPFSNVQNYQDRYSSDYSGKANPLIIKFSFEPSTVIATLTKPGMSPQIIDFEGISRFLILSTDKPDLKVNYTVKYEGCMEHILTFDPIKAEYFEVFVTGWTC